MTDNGENDNIWSAVIINKSKIINEFISVSFFQVFALKSYICVT